MAPINDRKYMAFTGGHPYEVMGPLTGHRDGRRPAVVSWLKHVAPSWSSVAAMPWRDWKRKLGLHGIASLAPKVCR